MSTEMTTRCLTPPRVFDAQHSYATPYGPRREVIPMAPARPLRTAQADDVETVRQRNEVDTEGRDDMEPRLDEPVRRVGRLEHPVINAVYVRTRAPMMAMT